MLTLIIAVVAFASGYGLASRKELRSFYDTHIFPIILRLRILARGLP